MNFNYSELLAFDRATSIEKTTNESSRKLVAWADRLTETDYPATWELDLLDGSLETLTLDSTSPHIWSSDNATLTIVFTDSSPSSFTLEYGDYSITDTEVSEGFMTLEDGDETVRVNLCDPEIRHGEKSVSVKFNDISRSAAADELDEYAYSRLSVIVDQEIKGHVLDGTWRLSSIEKTDSSASDTVSVELIYKDGCAEEIDLSEAIVLKKTDPLNDVCTLIVKFPAIDARYAETAKDEFSSSLGVGKKIQSPVIGGVVYDGYWCSTAIEIIESDKYGDANDCAEIVWRIEKIVTTTIVDGSVSFLKWETVDSRRYSSGTLRTNLILYNVDPPNVIGVRNEISQSQIVSDIPTSNGTISGSNYHVNTSTVRQDNGLYSIIYSTVTVPSEIEYIPDGERSTAYSTEYSRMYEGIPYSYVETLITDIVNVTGYSLVSSDTRKTYDPGVFDVYLRLKEIVDLGDAVRIGYTGGMFKSYTWMIRNIADADVSDQIQLLDNSALISNIRASRARDDGYWDIIYTRMEIPPSRVERKESYERRQGKSVVAKYKYLPSYTKIIKSAEMESGENMATVKYHYVPNMQRVITDYHESDSKLVRLVSVETEISYKTSDFGFIHGSWDEYYGRATTEEKVQLANGLWQQTTQEVEYEWWPDEVSVCNSSDVSIANGSPVDQLRDPPLP